MGRKLPEHPVFVLCAWIVDPLTYGRKHQVFLFDTESKAVAKAKDLCLDSTQYRITLQDIL